MLLFLLVGLGLVGWAVVGAIKDQALVPVLAWMAVELVLVVCVFGFFIVNPNEGRVMQLFGDYKGTVKTAGLRWANPFYSKRHISLRVRNFESGR
jgi:regulator of protease activity HflC (stomatin/prohibitin superfamily)